MKLVSCPARSSSLSAGLLGLLLSGCAPGSDTGAPTGVGGTTGTAGSTGSGGMTGAPSATGSAGTTGAAGRGGMGGSAVSPGTGDSFVSAVNIAVHPQTATILVVTWTQVNAADTTWLEFTFTGGSVMTSRPKPATAGAHREVVLGVPGSTMVTVRIVNRQGTVDHKTRDYQGMTGTVPAAMPKPTVISYDPALATKDRWMFGAVENSTGGCANSSCYYHTTFWVYIMDRQGRIVWYYADGASRVSTAYPRVARDGEYIVLDRGRSGGTLGVIKMTLDRSYFQMIALPVGDAIDVTTDGSILYDTNNELREYTRAGTNRTVWSCRSHFGSGFQCYTNTVNWDEATDTVMMSYPAPATVIQVHRRTGAVVGQYGARAGSYTFSPSTWSFEYQHFPNLTPQGTLILSSHMPGYSATMTPVANQHAFVEFEIDHSGKRLIEKWYYRDGPEWAMYKGMAMRLPNGNTLGNYGTGGVIREITPDKRTAFHVKFDSTAGNDFFNKMVGHNILLDDLYALNGGGPQP